MRGVYAHIKETGSSQGVPVPLEDFTELTKLMGFEDVWEEYCDHVERMETAPEKRYLQVHEGHCTYLVPAERRFVNEKTIRASVLIGTPAELAAATDSQVVALEPGETWEA